jgi:Novel STAND NTPase 1/WD domain, G-beta repeat
VTPGEGREDTRARSLLPDDPEQLDVISLFSNPKIRLLVTGFASIQETGRTSRDVRATVELAHEASIQRWPTLRAWVAQNRENLRSRSAILRAMQEWEEKSRNDDYLLPRGVQLERGRALLANPGDVPIDDVREYVVRSIKGEEDRDAAEQEADLADQKRIADAERQAKEAAEEAARAAAARAAVEAELRTTAEQKALLERQARGAAEERYRVASLEAEMAERIRKQRGRAAIGVVLGLALISIVSATWHTLYENASIARASAEQAKAALLRERAQNIALRADYALLYEGPAKALLIAEQAEKRGLPDLPHTERVLIEALRDLRERREISGLSNPVAGLAYSPDGRAIVSLDTRALTFWDAREGKFIDRLPFPSGVAGSFGLTWSADGDWIGVNLRNRTLLLRPCSHELIRAFFPSCGTEDQDQSVTLGDAGTAAGLPKFSNDGKWLVTGSWGEPPALWNVATRSGAPLGTKKAPTPNDVAISPDLKTIAIGFDNTDIELIDQRSGNTTSTLKAETDKDKTSNVLALEFNPRDTNMLAAALQDGNILVWDIKQNGYPLH